MLLHTIEQYEPIERYRMSRKADPQRAILIQRLIDTKLLKQTQIARVLGIKARRLAAIIDAEGITTIGRGGEGFKRESDPVLIQALIDTGLLTRWQIADAVGLKERGLYAVIQRHRLTSSGV